MAPGSRALVIPARMAGVVAPCWRASRLAMAAYPRAMAGDGVQGVGWSSAARWASVRASTASVLARLRRALAKWWARGVAKRRVIRQRFPCRMLGARARCTRNGVADYGWYCLDWHISRTIDTVVLALGGRRCATSICPLHNHSGTTPLNRGRGCSMARTGRVRHADASRVLLTRPGAQATGTRPPYFARIGTAVTRGSRGEGTAAFIVRRSGGSGA